MCTAVYYCISPRFSGMSLDDLCLELKDRKSSFSVFAPRKIPFLFKLFEKAGGDLALAKEKNYAKVYSSVTCSILKIIALSDALDCAMFFSVQGPM